MDHQSVLDFIEFSLLPFLSHKEIQLIQLKITQFKPKTKDALYLECQAFKKAIELIRKHKKNTITIPQNSEYSLYADFTKMDPEDVLLILADGRYQIRNEVMSMVLNKPIDSLVFRRNQIIESYKNDGLKNELKKMKTIPLGALTSELQHKLSHEQTSQQVLKAKLTMISRIPTPLKFILEMGGVLLLLFFILWLVPELRNTYENSVQKRINEYLIDASLTDSPPPAGLVKPQVIQEPETHEESQPSEPEKTEPTAELPAHKQPKVNDGETWRFSFTGGQGQTDLESNITEILKSRNQDKIKPLVVPGGIQFDFMLPSSELISLKTEFEQLTQRLQNKSNKAAGNTTSVPAIGSVNLSWYKKKIMGNRKVPSGHVLVIVWISTL